MAEYSYPVVNQPMTADGWRSVTLGVGNGILDQGGFPYRLTNFSNVDNTAVMKCPTVEKKAYGHAILEGFYHRYDADITLAFPAVSSPTRYYVVLQYDPLNETQPVALRVVKSLDYSQGKNYLHLYNVDRVPDQLLTDATVRAIRPRVAPVMMFASEDDLPQAQKSLWGTLAIVHGGRSSDRTKMFIAMTGDDAESVSGWFWKSIYDQARPEWLRVNDYENSVGSAGNGGPKELLRDGETRKMQGRVGRRDGSAYSSASGAGYLIATLGSADTPKYTTSPLVRCGGGTNGSSARGFVAIDRTTSEVRLYITDGNCLWVDLGTIEWRV